MAGEKIAQNGAPGLKSDPLTKPPEKVMASKKDGIVADSAPPVSSLLDASSGNIGYIDQALIAGQGAYYPAASCYNYYYPGYNGTYTQLDDQSYISAGGGSYSSVQSDNGSVLYYLPGYNPYGYMGVDGDQSYLSSGYLQQPLSYGSEALPPYSWDPRIAGDMTNKVNKTENLNYGVGWNGPDKSNGFNSSKTNTPSLTKPSNVPLNSKTRQSTVPSNVNRSFYQAAQPLKPQNKLASGYHSLESFNGYYPTGKYSAFGNQNQGVYMNYGAMNYLPNARTWNGNQRFKPRQNFRHEGEFEELTRGPRTDLRGDATKLSGQDEQPEQVIQRNKYNLEDFQTEYENAKFYVIKSYSEDDVHKCVKYDVWSSTPNGNKKLDAAFRGAEAKSIETDSKCPVFLFFSVNGSGQFTGVAEMIGPVDFKKNMDFWQLDKWSGFFPVKWHIVKDLPNNLLRHIILENNENRAVTYSRDTQEICLKQGLEMLKIFKTYSAKTSLLDDFNFYENREKTLKANRSSKQQPQSDALENDEVAKIVREGEKKAEEDSKTNENGTVPSLVVLTKNLSLNPQPLETNA